MMVHIDEVYHPFQFDIIDLWLIWALVLFIYASPFGFCHILLCLSMLKEMKCIIYIAQVDLNLKNISIEEVTLHGLT